MILSLRGVCFLNIYYLTQKYDYRYFEMWFIVNDKFDSEFAVSICMGLFFYLC